MKIRAVIVDDEPLARERIRALLARESDVEVVGECADGSAAIETIQRQRPDLVFLDVQMPGMDGFEVLREIRKRDTPGRPTPAIALTAHSSADYQVKTREAGFDAHVSKPFGMPDLLDAIVTVLERPDA